MKYYSEEHQWIEIEGNSGKVGITRFAADELGELSYVELPKVGSSYKQGEPLCVVESVKAASDVFMPVSGKIVEVNTELETTPELMNDEPEGAGWICVITDLIPDELEKLMDSEKYQAFLEKSK